MPSVFEHFYVKFKMIYCTTKTKNSLKKVAYPLNLFAGMQLLSFYSIHKYKICNTLLADAFIFTVT